MRLLVVSYYFPPFNTIGAVRVGKTAALLQRWGHDVRVLTAADQPLQPTLPVELDEARITRTPWLDVNAPAAWALGGRTRVAARGYASARGSRSWLGHLGRWYKTLLNFPDGQVGWLPWGTAAGGRIISRWRPDLIFASALPPTSLWIAARLARRFQLPWVAELRDLWADDPNNTAPRWRQAVERRWERSWLRSACGLVTVSEPLADQLHAIYGLPTRSVLNGFDPLDYPAEPTSSFATSDPSRLRIVYTGMIYAGRRSPEPLFAALARLGDRRRDVRVEFVGRYLDDLRPLAERYGVSEQVSIEASIPYRESLARQQGADVLLLLPELDPAQRGGYTGKLFEYLGARRPILSVGPDTSVATELLRARQAGIALEDPTAIAAQLLRWLDEKRARGTIAPLPAAAVAGLTREEQTRALEAFLLERLAATRHTTWEHARAA